MKVRKEILEMVRKNTKIRRELAHQLDVSDASIARYMRENSPNGTFTKVKAVKIIAENLNLPESIILEE
jgi:DeoR/GlpR family transcriptional regulator of sugar metabolism